VPAAQVGVKAAEGRQTTRKQFFFEKKNQKTFTLFGAWRWSTRVLERGKSFLFLFFKKEILLASHQPNSFHRTNLMLS
jgi:hypothetical protein